MSRTTVLAGGVGGARLARGLAAVLSDEALTIVGNVGDDDRIYGAHVSADLDTIMYTLAGIEGPQGWGVADDTFVVMDRLEALGVDTSFRLGDRDLAHCLLRTEMLDRGRPLSTIIRRLCDALGVGPTLLPASDDQLRTRVKTVEAGWLAFQDYFVRRGHRDEVIGLDYAGSADAKAAPGVIEAIETAELLLVAPSNPPLSVLPILSIKEVAAAVEKADRLVAVSPLFAGRALKGPADRVLASLGYAPGNVGVMEAYDWLPTDLVIDDADATDAAHLGERVEVHVTDTRIYEPAAAVRFAEWLLDRFA